MTVDAWLGLGLPFPVRPVRVGRAIGTVGGVGLVRQSIGMILDTEPGERVMVPGFGCGLRRYLMAPNTPATRAGMVQDITNALGRWEPRISVTTKDR
jgi:phage baseplate assembly protein W